MPAVGMVCVRHRRWLGYPQFDLHAYRPAITAEKQFRSRLVTRGLLFDSPAMVIGLEAALVAIGADEVDQRRALSGITVPDLLVYREQVSVPSC
jgi:hypothetical protein